CRPGRCRTRHRARHRRALRRGHAPGLAAPQSEEAGRHPLSASRAASAFARMGRSEHRGAGMALRIGVARETAPGERRVALTPETCRKLVAAGASVSVERGLGALAHFPDEAYATAGAMLVDDA